MKYGMKVTFKLIVESDSEVDAVKKINEMDYTFSYIDVDNGTTVQRIVDSEMVDIADDVKSIEG